MTAPYFDGKQACYGMDTAIFFGSGRGEAPAVVARAKTICRPCVHIVACLEYALTVPVENGRWVDGVWAATTPDERAEIRRAREQSGVA